MTFQIKTSIKIKATPQQIWTVFSNFENYKNWNPFITSISGEVSVSKKINITAGDMKFKPKVLIFEKLKELTWKGRLFLPYVFDGEHQFLLIDNKDGTTTFHQNENFKGILIPFFKKKLDTDVKSKFEQMNTELKNLVEQN
jgi:hypothetical protein